MTSSDSAGPATLSIVVPAFNEEATLARVVDKLIHVPYLFEIVIVDDCSSDRTLEIARQLAAKYPQVRALTHQRNRGKTDALRTGFAETKGDIVIVQDADLEYDPSEMKDVIQPIVEGVADVVFGSKSGARALFLPLHSEQVFDIFLKPADKHKSIGRGNWI
jgi:dolichol-phosphate mannosyltransferase